MRDYDNALLAVSELDIHQAIAFIKLLRDYPFGIGVPVNGQIALLNYAPPGYHENVVILVKFLHRHKGGYFLVRLYLKEIDNSFTSGSSAAFRYPENLQPVASPFIGEKQDVIVGGGYK